MWGGLCPPAQKGGVPTVWPVLSWALQHPTAKGSKVPELLDLGQAHGLDCGVRSTHAEADGPVNPMAFTLPLEDACGTLAFSHGHEGRLMVSVFAGLCAAVITSWGQL